MSTRASTRKRNQTQQFTIFDDYTKCRGLTHEEREQDLNMLKLAQAPSTKYKIFNPISKQKREIITSIYDKKNISLDLAKQNNQLISELTSLKRQIQKMKDDIISNQSQITISRLKKEGIQRQFNLLNEIKNKQIESLKQYNLQCTNSINKSQNELSKLTSISIQNITKQHQLKNALQTIQNLKNQLKAKENMIQSNNTNNNNNEILKLNEEIQQQQKINNVCFCLYPCT